MPGLIFLGLNNSVCNTQILLSDFDMQNNLNSLPPVISYQKTPSAYSIATSLFPEMKFFSSEEQRRYTEAINKIYKPTGKKLF